MPRYSGKWYLLDEPHPRAPYVALTADGSVAEPQHFTHHAWEIRTPADFAERIMFDWIAWCTHEGGSQSFRIAEYADPPDYLPYVQGIAEVIIRGFTAITPTDGW